VNDDETVNMTFGRHIRELGAIPDRDISPKRAKRERGAVLVV